MKTLKKMWKKIDKTFSKIINGISMDASQYIIDECDRSSLRSVALRVQTKAGVQIWVLLL